MSRLPTYTQQMNLPALVERFNSEEKCRAYLEELRWPEGVRCPRCVVETTISRIKTRSQFECDACGYQFSVTSGTVFHDSHLPLWKWFMAVYLIGESKKGISSNQLKRMLGVSYKTAWHLSHRIRSAMDDEGMGSLLMGIIEADETYVGPSIPGGSGRGAKTNVVLGAVERGGRVRMKVMDRVTRQVLHGFLNSVVDRGAEAIYTDALPAYRGIGDADTRHGVVNHSRAWVEADVHTNTIEGVWSLLKRSIIGSYHHLSIKHLPAYLDEMAFRYNNRENAYLFRDTLRRLIRADDLPYTELIAEGTAPTTGD
jgi:transposase-like protein